MAPKEDLLKVHNKNFNIFEENVLNKNGSNKQYKLNTS